MNTGAMDRHPTNPPHWTGPAEQSAARVNRDLYIGPVSFPLKIF
jgi:hypothetical protein